MCCSPVCIEERKPGSSSAKRILVSSGTDEQNLSQNKLKKLRRFGTKSFTRKSDKFPKCHNCGNPKVRECLEFELELKLLFDVKIKRLSIRLIYLLHMTVTCLERPSGGICNFYQILRVCMSLRLNLRAILGWIGLN